uniref:small monomeric GTPase n=1 Tax=Esox lucius TaxID=8010 RepID=A0A6Q2WYX2_ESOLU
MRLLVDPPRTMNSGSSNFLLVPIPEYPVLDCVPNKNVKIVVLGASNVGKTALIVRFLTKRFIGDYEANTGALYSRKISIDGEQVSLQVQDTPCVSLQVDLSWSIFWLIGVHVLFNSPLGNLYFTRKYFCSLVGNKSDLLRARQVPHDEGETLAASLGGAYFEASARENHEGVHSAFLHLCGEVSRALGGGNGEKRRGGLHLARPKSPNMQELKRRFRQVLSSKGKSSTTTL